MPSENGLGESLKPSFPTSQRSQPKSRPLAHLASVNSSQLITTQQHDHTMHTDCALKQAKEGQKHPPESAFEAPRQPPRPATTAPPPGAFTYPP